MDVIHINDVITDAGKIKEEEETEKSLGCSPREFAVDEATTGEQN